MSAMRDARVTVKLPDGRVGDVINVIDPEHDRLMGPPSPICQVILFVKVPRVDVSPPTHEIVKIAKHRVDVVHVEVGREGGS